MMRMHSSSKCRKIELTISNSQSTHIKTKRRCRQNLINSLRSIRKSTINNLKSKYSSFLKSDKNFLKNHRKSQWVSLFLTCLEKTHLLPVQKRSRTLTGFSMINSLSYKQNPSNPSKKNHCPILRRSQTTHQFLKSELMKKKKFQKKSTQVMVQPSRKNSSHPTNQQSLSMTLGLMGRWTMVHSSIHCEISIDNKLR